jgi:hypothetical protein
MAMKQTHQSPATDQSESSADAAREALTKSAKPKSRKAGDAAAESVEPADRQLLTITVDPDTARVVRIEKLEEGGKCHELTTSDREVLLSRATDGRLEDVVERAFEAGIACVLDDEAVPIASNESADEAELRHRLLAPLIERSVVRHLMERAVLDRAILSTLIDHSTTQA